LQDGHSKDGGNLPASGGVPLQDSARVTGQGFMVGGVLVPWSSPEKLTGNHHVQRSADSVGPARSLPTANHFEKHGVQDDSCGLVLSEPRELCCPLGGMRSDPMILKSGLQPLGARHGREVGHSPVHQLSAVAHLDHAGNRFLCSNCKGTWLAPTCQR
jgi:hypothetical protein